MASMPEKKVNKGGRPSRGRGGPRYNLNLRAQVRRPIAMLTAAIQLEEGRVVPKAEALEIAIKEALEARGYEYLEDE